MARKLKGEIGLVFFFYYLKKNTTKMHGYERDLILVSW